MLIIITLLFQICVSGVCGAAGRPVQSHAAVESGSAPEGPWPLLQDPTVKANRHRARAATRDFAQVQLGCISYSLWLRYLCNWFKSVKRQAKLNPASWKPVLIIQSFPENACSTCSKLKYICFYLYSWRIILLDPRWALWGQGTHLPRELCQSVSSQLHWLMGACAVSSRRLSLR